MLLKGEGESADHIVGGAEWPTLSHDAFPAQEFDFVLANPPYGKSWKKDLEALGGKDKMRDPRFKVMHDGEELSLVTRSSDGQLLFLANMASKMNHKSVLGSRVAEVHNGSSLFTGDAGQGESNIRRWLIESDWVEGANHPGPKAVCQIFPGPAIPALITQDCSAEAGDVGPRTFCFPANLFGRHVRGVAQ